MRMIGRGALLLTVVLLTARTLAGEPSSPSGRVRSSVASLSPHAPGVFVRDCNDSVYGELGRGGGRTRWFSARSRSWASRVPSRARSLLPIKAWAIPVPQGLGRGKRWRRDRGLDYRSGHRPSPHDVRPLRLGRPQLVPARSGRHDHRVRAVSAPSVDQFNGGFLVTDRTCATLEVSTGGGEPLRRLVSFGALSCRGEPESDQRPMSPTTMKMVTWIARSGDISLREVSSRRARRRVARALFGARHERQTVQARDD
jgi:hypothetical protein